MCACVQWDRHQFGHVTRPSLISGAFKFWDDPSLEFGYRVCLQLDSLLPILPPSFPVVLLLLFQPLPFPPLPLLFLLRVCFILAHLLIISFPSSFSSYCCSSHSCCSLYPNILISPCFSLPLSPLLSAFHLHPPSTSHFPLRCCMLLLFSRCSNLFCVSSRVGARCACVSLRLDHPSPCSTCRPLDVMNLLPVLSNLSPS